MFKKILIIVFLLFLSFFTVLWEDWNADISQKTSFIKETIKEYQLKNNYIDFTYPMVSFWESMNDTINIKIFIKNPQWDIINYNWELSLEPLIFWTSFNFWEIPKSLNIVNWVWELNISVSQVDDGLIDEESWLWLVISSLNHDLVWNILTFAYWSKFIDINNYLWDIVNNNESNLDNNSNNVSGYQLYSDIYPEKRNINNFKSVNLNDNWEYVIEYTKDNFDKLIKVLWWKNILVFDEKNNNKNKFNSSIKEVDNSVFVTILKDNLDLAYKCYNDFFEDNWKLCNFQTFNWYYYRDFYSHFDEDIWKFLSDIDNWNLWDINTYIHKYTNTNIWLIDWKFYISAESDYDNYILNKYNKYFVKSTNIHFYILGEFNEEKIYWFPIKDIDIIKDFLKDQFYYWYLSDITSTNNNLIIKNSKLYLDLWDNRNTKNSDITIALIKDNEDVDLTCQFSSDSESICEIYTQYGNDIIDVSREDFFEWNLLNISAIIENFQKYWYLQNFSIKDIYDIDFFTDWLKLNYAFWYLKNEKDILPIASQIKSPKNISTNPYLISVNFILALLYLLAFYFTAQLFNSYFEELSSKNKWNEKIASNLKKYSKLPLNKLYDLLIKKNNPKLKLFTNKIRNFLIKYEHKIYIIIWFLILWIIGQIVVDDFDILSLKWWFTILIMIFILAFITLFKDMLLYIFNKWKARETLKLENIPVWFIFAWIVAIFGRWIWLIPWVMFGSTIKLDAKSNLTSRQTSKPTLLLKVLLIVFLVWLASWFLTIPFDSNSFIYKFLIVTYFGLVNDVFFALLPFGMLWWIYILKDKKLRIKWFIFTFIIFFFLLHTVLHWEGDLNKILQFDWNFAILVWILFFWIIITGVMYYKTKNK